MKVLFENWRQYLKEEKKEISSKEELVNYLNDNPSETLPTKINIENPAGTVKAFKGTQEKKLPFHYGEWPHITNPADNMGWDLIIAPGSSKTSQNLKPIGHAEYADGSGNDKIIISDDGIISEPDKKIISEFFKEFKNIFKEIEWY